MRLLEVVPDHLCFSEAFTGVRGRNSNSFREYIDCMIECKLER